MRLKHKGRFFIISRKGTYSVSNEEFSRGKYRLEFQGSIEDTGKKADDLRRGNDKFFKKGRSVS